MAVTTTGFQGTISDAAMATQLGAHHVATVRRAADLAVSAVASNRQVSVAAGVSDQAFVKYVSDTAQTLTLAPPSSGGKWYLIGLNRQWSPTNTVTLEAVDTGATNDGTVPTVIPAAVLTAAQAVTRTNPGTAGSTVAYGATHTLALVHVRAADTTLTIFDLRATRTGAGGVLLPTPYALAHAAGYMLDGAVVTIGRYLISGALYHESSSWTRVAGSWRQTPGTAIQTSGAGNPNDVGTQANSISAVATAYPALLLLMAGNTLRDITTGIEARWTTAGKWMPWSSEWRNADNFPGALQGLYGQNGRDPGWSAGMRYRFVNGMVRCEFAIQLINGGSGGNVRGPLPVPLENNIPFSGSRIGHYEGLTLIGHAVFRKFSGGNEYQLSVGPVNDDYFRLISYTSTTDQRTEAGGGQPNGWGDGDGVSGQFEYSPDRLASYSAT